MRASVMATANRRNPQPLPKKSVDSVTTPAVVGSAKHHTVVTQPGGAHGVPVRPRAP